MMKDDVFVEESRFTEPDYETERNKPMPNRIHGHIQTKLLVRLDQGYGDQFNIESEVTLDTKPKSSTPDIAIYPKETLSLKDIRPKATEMPLTTIEIQSPSQSPEDLVAKAWEYYFPAGVKSAWVVIPSIKGVRIVLPNNQNLLFISGEIQDPTNGISVPVDKIFEGIEL
ncbi:MAG: Uma2 family endonuclease [Lewinellaceae bacterium]|nr:Uma2 family endonuclease [Saprospiraceae bacterium]MCB9339418.1 Uma2 family endonuclease [Lewinellaceae bacterium]